MQRRRERALRIKTRRSERPAAEPPSGRQDLKGHNGDVERVVALPESGLIATACWAIGLSASSALRIFALDGDDEPLHTLDFEFSYSPCGLAAVGDDVVACGGEDGKLMTCRASTGERLETLQLESRSPVTAMVMAGDGVFVVGCFDGALFSIAHSDGRNLRVVTQYESAHTDLINDIAARGDVVVTASDDKTAAVWSAATHERLAVLRGHGGDVNCAAICERFIATDSSDKSIRVYENKGGYSLVRVLEGLHTNWVLHVEFVGEDLLMSASLDRTLAFTSFSTGKPVARVGVGFAIGSVAILPDGPLACVGRDSGAVVLSPPALVADEVKKHAATLFPRPLDMSIAESEPLQSAMIDVCAGRLSAGDACRKFVTKEKCSRSVEEWGLAHCLLMAAVESGEIPRERNFGESLSHWFLNLYAPARCFALGSKDLETVKLCAHEAHAAGVLPEPDAVFATVLAAQDLSQEVARLEKSGQSMLGMLSQLLVAQAENDEKMMMMGKEIARQARMQKFNALLAAIFSFAPLGGAAAANAIGAVAEALPLLESMLSTGVAIQGAATPALLNKFVFRAEAMVSLEGWERVTPENRVAVRHAAEGLDMSWEVFCGMVRDAADARRDANACEADGGPGEAVDAGEGYAHAQGPGGEEIALDGSASHANDVADSGSASLGNGDEGGDVEVLGAQESAGSTSVSGVTLENSPIESALARLESDDVVSDGSFSALEVAASDVHAVRSMKGESLSGTIAAVMVNFDDDLLSDFYVLANCLRIVFRIERLSGDMIVGYSGSELQERIVDGLRCDDSYRKLGDNAASSFEWRLQQYLRGLRLS